MIWFISDTHFNHNAILVYGPRTKFLSKEELKKFEAGEPIKGKNRTWRPSDESIQRMNDYIIDRINEFVRPQDDLYHLGDFGCLKKQDVKNLRNRINVRNFYLIYGNHDRKVARRLQASEKVFTDAFDLRQINYHKQKFVLCHYAMASWNKHHRGSIHLYGHSHGEIENYLDIVFPQRRSIDVGLDNLYKILGDYRPISIEEVLEIMKDRDGHSLKHNS